MEKCFVASQGLSRRTHFLHLQFMISHLKEAQNMSMFIHWITHMHIWEIIVRFMWDGFYTTFYKWGPWYTEQ